MYIAFARIVESVTSQLTHLESCDLRPAFQHHLLCDLIRLHKLQQNFYGNQWIRLHKIG